MRITHQRQPSRTSCGVACAAMLAGVSVSRMLAMLPAVRVSARRGRAIADRVNVGELGRLLERYGLRLGRRRPGVPPLDRARAVLRIPHPRGAGWHWCVIHRGRVLDPMEAPPVSLAAYMATHRPGPVSWYPVDRQPRTETTPAERAGFVW